MLTKFNKYGRNLSIIAAKGKSLSVVIIPENQFNEGWGKLAVSSTRGAFASEINIKMNTFTGKGNYKIAISSNKCSQRKAENGFVVLRRRILCYRDA